MTGNHTTADETSATNQYRLSDAAARDHSAGKPVSTTVILSVADELGVGPLDLDVCLNDVVDPDALDALVESMEYGHVEFTIAGCNVRVQANGEVFVGKRT